MSICQSDAMFSLSGSNRYKIYHSKQHFSPPATAWRFTKMKQVVSKNLICKLWSKLENTEKQESIHSYSLWFLYLNADCYLSKHCRLTIFSWASVPILDFLDQQEKFVISTTYVTKLTLAAKVIAFICKILWFKVLKRCLTFSQLVDRMLENKSLHQCNPTRRVHHWHIFLV